MMLLIYAILFGVFAFAGCVALVLSVGQNPIGWALLALSGVCLFCVLFLGHDYVKIEKSNRY